MRVRSSLFPACVIWVMMVFWVQVHVRVQHTSSWNYQKLSAEQPLRGQAVWTVLSRYKSCLMPHASCLMPHASCLMPHASCVMPHARQDNGPRHHSRFQPHRIGRYNHQYGVLVFDSKGYSINFHCQKSANKFRGFTLFRNGAPTSFQSFVYINFV